MSLQDGVCGTLHSRPIPHHPEIRRDVFFLVGPREKKDRLVLSHERGEWVWRYKRAKEHHYVYIGPVSQFCTCDAVKEEIRLIDLVAQIY